MEGEGGCHYRGGTEDGLEGAAGEDRSYGVMKMEAGVIGDCDGGGGGKGWRVEDGGVSWDC